MSNPKLPKIVPLLVVLAIGLLAVLRVTILDGPKPSDVSSGSVANAESATAANASAPPGWVRFENSLFEGWIHPDWVVGTIDLNHFVTDEAVSHLAPLVRQALTQQSHLLKDTTIVWVKLSLDEGASGIQIHGCLGPSAPPGEVVTPEMMAEMYKALGMRATPAGTFKFGGGQTPVVRINEPPGDTQVLQVMLMGKDCSTTAESFAPIGDADSMQLFQAFIENLRFKN